MWKGIDVSDNQGVIDWAEVKAAGVQFAILRSVRGSGKVDYQFANNVAGCLKNDIPLAVYKYTYATSQQAAEVEARQVVALLQSYGLKNTMVWWDVEDETLKELGKATLTVYVKVAQAVIEAAGYRFGLYVGYHVVNERWFDLSEFPTAQVWTARYYSGYSVVQFGDDPDAAGIPQIGRPLWGWQHTSTGRVPGIKGNVDLDVCYQDPAEWELSAMEPGVIWCVSIADVWAGTIANAVAAAYPGCLVHYASVLDVGGIEVWIASIADVWTQTQAEVARGQFAALGITGKVHKVQILE